MNSNTSNNNTMDLNSIMVESNRIKNYIMSLINIKDRTTVLRIFEANKENLTDYHIEFLELALRGWR